MRIPLGCCTLLLRNCKRLRDHSPTALALSLCFSPAGKQAVPYANLNRLILGMLFASTAFASPCATATLATYDAAAFTCTINGEIVENFTFSVMSMSAGYSPLTDSQIMVTPSFTATSYQVYFSSDGFSLTGTQFVSYEFNFTWDPVVVGSEDDMVSRTPVFPGYATVVTDICAGTTFSATCPAGSTYTLTVSNNGVISVPSDSTYFAPVTVVDTQSLLTLNANTASSEIAGFANSVLLVTPEPGAGLLVGCGFLGMGLVALFPWRRGRRLKEVF